MVLGACPQAGRPGYPEAGHHHHRHRRRAGRDGQVLVWQDMLGLNGDKVPKFVRCFAPVGQTMTQAFRERMTAR